jgi:uncharacterized protein (TIGR03067 family)
MFGASMIVACTCVLGCGGSGNQGSGDPALVGTWVGTAVGHDPTTVWTFTATSTNVEVKIDTVATYRGTYVADASSNPKTITITITDSTVSLYIGQTSNGIYKIEGSTLTFAANKPGTTARPTDFIPTADGVTEVFTLNKQ